MVILFLIILPVIITLVFGIFKMTVLTKIIATFAGAVAYVGAGHSFNVKMLAAYEDFDQKSYADQWLTIWHDPQKKGSFGEMLRFVSAGTALMCVIVLLVTQK